MPIDNRVGASESTASDVYSFGVFLMELLTGQEDLDIGSLGSNESLFQRVRATEQVLSPSGKNSFLIPLSMPGRNTCIV